MFEGKQNIEERTTLPNVKYGLALAEQSCWNAGEYANSDYSLRAVSKRVGFGHGRIYGLLSQGSVDNQTVGQVDYWVCQLHPGRSKWEHPRRYCCQQPMGRVSTNEAKFWECTRCGNEIRDKGGLGPPDFSTRMNGDPCDANYAMTVDWSGLACVFIDDACGDENIKFIWQVAEFSVKSVPVPENLPRLLTTAHFLKHQGGTSLIYVQGGYDGEFYEGILSFTASTCAFTEWPLQEGEMQYWFSGRIVSLGEPGAPSLLVGMNRDGVVACRIAVSGQTVQHGIWKKVLELPERACGASHRVLSHGPEKNQIVLFDPTHLEGVLEPGLFLRPSHVIEVNELPAGSGEASVDVQAVVQNLSALVSIPFYAPTLHQSHRRTKDPAMNFREWNGTTMPLAFRDGGSFVFFEHSDNIYRIWDDEILPANEAWHPPVWAFEFQDIEFHFSASHGTDVHKIKCPSEPLLRYPYFQALSERWKEGQSHVVCVEDVQPDTFKTMLRFILTGALGRSSLNDAMHLLRVAHKYMITDLIALLLQQLRKSLKHIRDLAPALLLELLSLLDSIGSDGANLVQHMLSFILSSNPSLLKNELFIVPLAEHNRPLFLKLMEDCTEALQTSNVKYVSRVGGALSRRWGLQNSPKPFGSSTGANSRTRSRSR